MNKLLRVTIPALLFFCSINPAIAETSTKKGLSSPESIQQPQSVPVPTLQTQPVLKKKAGNATDESAVDRSRVPQKIPVQPRPISGERLPGVQPGVSPRQMQQSHNQDLPQPTRTAVDAFRDSIRIRVSGVGPYGGSTVGGDSGPLLLGSENFIVLVEHGPLSMTGVVPGEATGYFYYLYVNPESTARPTGCAVDPRTGVPRGSNPDHPDIQNDGRVRVLGSGLSRQIRDVSVPTHESRLARYYLMLCVVGTRGEPRQYAAIASNVAEVQVLGDSSRR